MAVGIPMMPCSPAAKRAAPPRCPRAVRDELPWTETGKGWVIQKPQTVGWKHGFQFLFAGNGMFSPFAEKEATDGSRTCLKFC